MASYDHIVQQLKGCSAFFESQSQLLGQARLQESQMQMAKSIAAQIKTIVTLSPAAAARLNEAISHSGFPLESKQLLATTVSELTVGLVQSEKQARRTTQTLTNVQAYMTEGDWEIFNNKSATAEQKIIKLVDRLVLLGLRNPSEITIKSCIALVACSHFQHPPDANVLHGLVVQLKLAMQARKAIDLAGLEFLAVYPEEPSVPPLTTELFSHAYPNPQDKPVLRIIDGYSAMLSCIPMRTTNKALAKNAGAVPAQGLQDMFQDFLAQVGYSCPGLVVKPSPAATGTRSSDRAASALSQTFGMQQLPGLLPLQNVQGAGGQPQFQAAVGAFHPGWAQQAAVGAFQPGSPQTSSSFSPEPKNMLALMDATGPPAAEQGTPPQGKPSESPAAEQGTPPPTEEHAAEDEIKRLEKIAAAGTGPDLDGASSATGGKRKATGEAKAKAKAKSKAKKDASSTEIDSVKNMHKKPAASETRLRLGCSKCRGSPAGCTQCRSSSFGGKRFTS